MDIETIRAWWQADEYEMSIEVVGRLEQREVTLENIGEAIISGRIIEERRKRRARVSYTVQG